MKRYEIIEHTADVGLKARGETLKKLFENSAEGMFRIIIGEKPLRRTRTQLHKKIEIKKEVEALEELLVAWLSELLFIFNQEEILLRDFKVLELNNNGIVAEVSGDKINTERAGLQTEIKAVTFHGLKIEDDQRGFSCKIIFDV